MIRILCGRQGSGKTEQILRHAAALPRTQRIYLTVPEQFTFETERMLFDVLGTEGILHIRVVSLQRLASLIGAKTPLKNRTVLTQEGKALIVKHIVDESTELLRMFRGVSGKAGFLDRVVSFVGELKENAVSSVTLMRLAEQENNGTLKGKLGDLALIYRRYEEILSRDYIDPQDYLSECAQYVSSDDEIRGSAFFFDGFYTFDRSVYPLIEAVMAAADSCEIALTFGEDSFFSVTADTLRSLQECAQRVVQPCEVIALGDKYTQNEAIAFAESHLMTYEPAEFRVQTESVCLIRSRDADAEIETVASEILRLAREGHYRFSDISVIASDLEAYAQQIEEVFSRKEIACFIDRRKQIIYSSPVRAFLFLIAMTDRQINTTELIAFAKTGFSDISDDECMLLENYVLECGIKGSMWEKEFVRNNAESSYDLGVLEEIRNKLLQPVLAVREAVAGASDMKGYCKSLHSALDEWGLREKIQTCSAAFAKDGDYETANTYAQIYNQLLAVLDQTYDFFGSEQLSAREFHDMLAYALGQSTVGIIPSVIDKVTVGDVRRSRAGNVKVLFLLGANEGLLPFDTSDQGILSDEEKESVRVKGLQLLRSGSYNRAKEEFLIYTLIAKPSERLYVSRFLKDRDGEECQPSFVYERIAELFPNARIRTDEAADPSEELAQLDDRHIALLRLGRNLSERKTQKDHSDVSDPLYDDVYRYFSAEEPEKAAFLMRGLSFDNAAAVTDADLLREAMPLPVSLSVSRLETYAACPFRFFAEYLLHPTQRRQHEVRSTDIGSVLHKIVELYSSKILDHSVDVSAVTPNELSDLSAAITEQVLAQYSAGLFSQISKSPYLRKKLLRAAQAAVAEITRQLSRSDFMLTETEAKFRFGEKYQPICADIEGVGKVYLQGIIDRIDTYESGGTNYVRVIDYKTGSRDFDLTKAYYGLSMQLPVYISAATQQGDSGTAAGVFYFRIKPPMVKISRELSEEDIARRLRKEFALRGIAVRDLDIIKAMDNEAEHDSFLANVSMSKDGTLRGSDSLIEPELFDALLRRTQQTVEESAKKLLGGTISVTPYRYGKREIPCDWCSYRPVCKFSEGFSANGYREIRKKKAEELYAVLDHEKGGMRE
ncbi:MAG: PD-(D/E)XK nuclease family protein [Anaerofustis sp.]